ncbi:MAG: hypothetical protein ABL958_02815 [Bdellovibrionia bacterium]
MKRISGIILFALFTAACASAPQVAEIEPQPEESFVTPAVDEFVSEGPVRKKNWKDKYVGVTGLFTRPPMFVLSEDSAIFQRCTPFKIIGFESRADTVIMKIKQGANTIQIAGVNRKPLKLGNKKRLRLVNKFFVKKLDFLPARNIAASEKGVCDGQFRQNMSKKEFLFLSGDPDEVKREVSSAGPHERWIYGGQPGTPGVSYYFKEDSLYSWTK